MPDDVYPLTAEWTEADAEALRARLARYGGASEDAPRTTTGVRDAIARLQNARAQLRKVIDLATERLGPVLTPETPTETLPAAGRQPPSPLALEIALEADVLATLTGELHALLLRVDL